MNTKTLWICAIALLALAVIGVSGCGRNEAEDPVADPVELEASAKPQQLAESEALLVEQRLQVAEREVELAQRELSAAEAERKLAERAIQLEKRRAELAYEPQERAAIEAEPFEREELFEPLPDFEQEPVVAQEPAIRTVSVRVPASTPISVEFTDPLSSETNLIGDGFRATVSRDVFEDGYLAIPAGSKVLGTVANVVPSKKIGGQASMELSFDRVDLPSGEIVPIRSFVQLTGQNQKKKDAATIGGSAAGGAVVGRIFSKKKSKGTAVGAILGAAVGAAVASRNPSDPVVVEPGMPAELFLESSVEVAVVVEPTDAIANNR